MPIAPVTANGLCVACLVVDSVARALRLRVLLHRFGGSIGVVDSLRANLVEDAAAALTPMRLGGNPARAVVLRGAGVDIGPIVLASVAESAVMYSLVVLAATGLAIVYAPDWWRIVGQSVRRSAVHLGPWLALAAALGLVTWLIARRLVPVRHDSALRTLTKGWHELRRAGAATLGWSVALTLASIVARVAILPLLTSTLVPAPPLGVVTFSSFTLLYGQLLLPTPSGAGAVELGFLAGGAGVVGAAATRLLLMWRIYTTLTSVVAGFLVTARHAGAALVRRVAAARRRRANSAGEGETS